MALGTAIFVTFVIFGSIMSEKVHFASGQPIIGNSIFCIITLFSNHFSWLPNCATIPVLILDHLIGDCSLSLLEIQKARKWSS